MGLYLQYHEFYPSTPVRVAQIEDHPIHLEILGSGAHPSRKPKPRPNGSLLRGEIYADSTNGHRSCCVRSACSPSIRGTYASERGYYYFPSRAAPGEAASFPGGRIERDPILANLAQYVIAQERLTQRVMGYLQSLADLNPQIAIGKPLRPDQERRFHRLVNPLPPTEEECAPVPDVSSGPCPFTVVIVDVTAMFIVLAFIYVLQLMRGILNLCDELNF